LVEVIVNADPCGVPLPYAEVFISSAPVRQVVREQTPGAAASQYILDSVDDLAHRVEAVAATRSFIRQQRLEYSPFGI
jgi:hypothetical protein